MLDGSSNSYLMENAQEGKRLELKTDQEAVKRQAAWAGIGEGMRVLDVGCGTGITTSVLAELVGESGHATGLDFSERRLAEAREKFGSENIDFVQHDIVDPFTPEVPYDAIWGRFILEYFRDNQATVIRNVVAALRPGGLACFADLDNNILNHWGLSAKLMATLKDVAANLEIHHNFDPYAGRRLFGHLMDLGFQDIACNAEMHHLIAGQTSEREQYNWLRKLEIAAKNSGCTFSEYDGSFDDFYQDARDFLNSPQRFTYTPLIIVRGRKPQAP